MNAHPNFESLSAYFDKACGPEEAAFISAHLPVCGRCRGVVESFAESRRILRKSWEAPPMPRELFKELSAAGRRRSGSGSGFFLMRTLRELGAGFSGAPSWAAAAALCAAFAYFLRGERPLPSGAEIPADLFVAAHGQYELTLPLAPAESILTGISPSIAAAESGPVSEENLVF